MKMKKEGSATNTKNFMENTPEDITPKDDAFHGSIKRLSAEWWYFDAVFDNGIAVHIGCMTYSKKDKGKVTKVLDVYKDGKLIFGGKKKYRFIHFETSKEIPYVKVDGESFIEFDEETYKKNKQWSYNISLKLDNQEIKLNFIGTTKGWKIETERESWTVAAPKAKVTGEMTLNGEKIKLNGIGYHDHNWNYNLKTLLTYGKGWYWGRIMSKKYNLIFANIIRPHEKSLLLSVINEDGTGYISINPKNIEFIKAEYVKHKRKKVPSEYILKIKDLQNKIPIDIEVIMKTTETHYERRMLFMSYFRFYEKSSGYISVNNKKEKVNDSQIMELLKFR